MPAIDNSVAPPLTAAAREVLVFKLGGEEYGIDIHKVQELRGCEHVTRIASAPPFMRGVINLRGAVVPLVDMRVRFGLAHSIDEASCDQFTVVVVLDIGERAVGMVVDSVSDVIELAPDQVRPVPPGAGALGSPAWTGMGVRDDRMVILLDIMALMSGVASGLH